MNGIGIFSEKFLIKQLNVWNFAYISRIGKFDGIRTSKYRYKQSFCADYDCAAGLKKKSAFRYQKDIRSWRTIRTREPCRHHCFSMGLLVGRSWRPTRNTDFRKVSTHDLGWSARRAICRKKGRCGRHRSLSQKTNAQPVCRYLWHFSSVVDELDGCIRTDWLNQSYASLGL